MKYRPTDLAVALLVGAITCGVMGYAVVVGAARAVRSVRREVASA